MKEESKSLMYAIDQAIEQDELQTTPDDTLYWALVVDRIGDFCSDTMDTQMYP